MSNPENKYKLAPVNAELAAKVREKFGWEYSIQNLEEEITGLDICLLDEEIPFEQTPEIANLKGEFNNLTEGEEK